MFGKNEGVTSSLDAALDCDGATANFNFAFIPRFMSFTFARFRIAGRGPCSPCGGQADDVWRCFSKGCPENGLRWSVSPEKAPGVPPPGTREITLPYSWK